jgi:hypothetical protein
VGRGLLAVAAVIVGLGTVLLVLAVGHCSAFGGTCPRQSGFPDDTFRLAALGGGLAVAVPYYLKHPSWRRLAAAAVVAVATGALVGLFAVAATAG